MSYSLPRKQSKYSVDDRDLRNFLVIIFKRPCLLKKGLKHTEILDHVGSIVYPLWSHSIFEMTFLEPISRLGAIYKVLDLEVKRKYSM